MKTISRFTFISLITVTALVAQDDTTLAKDAIYARPFITGDLQSSLSVGGYFEGNTNYFSEDGVSEGFSMELRRFNVFLYSSLHSRIKFLSELEFEHGTEEIAIETAQLDFQLDPAFSVKAGILLVPIGQYNINHDSPKWEFVDRPLVTTEIIPSTLSDVGFGFHGRFRRQEWTFAYDAVVVNGLGDGIILNDNGRTDLQSGKREAVFEEDNNGSPAWAARLSTRYGRVGEIGLSMYRGVYNSYKIEGDAVDVKRHVTISALDYSFSLWKATVQGEAAIVRLDVPSTIRELYGNQWGMYIEGIYPLWQGRIGDFERLRVNVVLRYETVDFNSGTFTGLGSPIKDDVSAVVAGFSIRPTSTTVIKANYRSHSIRDILGNTAVTQAGFQVGIASYF
jgi:hypothetical protein